MRVYADTSFIVRLATDEAGTGSAIDEYRRLGRPRLVYLTLHALEVENAIYQRAFHLRRSQPSNQRRYITRERDTALSRIAHLRRQSALVDIALDMDSAMEQARDLSRAHAERLGARAIDVLHIACALLLKTELFLSFDERQVQIAKAEGIKAPVLALE